MATRLSPPRGIALHCLAAQGEREADRALQAQAGLSFAQAIVLFFIKQSQPRVCQRTIAEACGMTEASVSRHIDQLVAHDLVARTEDADNRRQNMLTLTGSGSERLRRALKIIDLVFAAAEPGWLKQ